MSVTASERHANTTVMYDPQQVINEYDVLMKELRRQVIPWATQHYMELQAYSRSPYMQAILDEVLLSAQWEKD